MSKFTPAQCHETRTWLRALLRECTYLPDQQARSYLSGHVVNRFRDYAPGHKPEPALEQRRFLQLAQARKALSELRRANAGELKPLLKVLHLTYGRIGKRRQQLLRPLLHVPSASTDGDKNSLPQLSPQHTALLLSQIQASPPPTTRPHPRSLELKMPEKNSWERPLPKKRVANLTRQWYAKMLERTYVPLPVDEWERLRDLALGKSAFKGPMPRRLSAPSPLLHSSPLEHTLGLASETSPEATLARTANPIHGHTLTSRFMRRCWSTVFAQCPVMTWDNKSEKWSIEWGSNVIAREKVAQAMDASACNPP